MSHRLAGIRATGFAAFFNELKAHGIDETNTLFVVTADEGDHFAGVTKTDCDGVITTPCVYDIRARSARCWCW